MNEDSVERSIEICAPRARVWRAINNPKDFGTWFGIGTPLELVGDFAPGARVTMKGGELFCTIRTVEPERRLTFDWTPYELAPGEDPATHPTTQVEMRLEDTANGTRLVVVESGFSKLPADKQYKRGDNAEGWAVQVHSIAAHVLGKIMARSEERIARPRAEVLEAIVDPAQMAKYFISHGSARMTAGAQITWEWSDYKAQATVRVQEVTENKIDFTWTGFGESTKVVIALAADGNATKIACTEGPYELTEERARRAIEQTQGWTNFCCCLKAYLEHGIDLRRGKRVA
jgi:uncharacterized protein YndB with AHSA1/START domain